ncbi:MAG: ATP-binding protein [Ruminobacter sp.]|jgi:DNA replication protein DnaC|nr:ATP-binding protein [Ruminobacter sp.]MBR1924487.1 ATP-binding protein [Ruminobacter sp.]
MAGEKEKLIDEIFGMVTDTLSGKTVDSDKLQILARQLEEATGSKISTYEEIQQTYDNNAMRELKELQERERKNRVEYLTKNCEISPYWEYENMDLSYSQDYFNIVEYTKRWCETFELQEQGYRDNNTGKVYTGGSLMWLYGDYGVGKSMLAGSIAHKVMRDYLIEFIFMQWDTINSKLQGLSGYDNTKEYNDFCQQLQTNRLLIIDEVGIAEKKLTEIQGIRLGELLRWRKNNKLNTIMISNADPEKLYDLVGKFCYESIKNYSPVIPLQLIGPNRRTNSINGFNDASKDFRYYPKGGMRRK